MIPGKGGAGDGKRSPWEWRVADPVAYKLELVFPISRFVSQKDSKDSGYYSLCARPRWGPIKDPSLWCFNPWLFGERGEEEKTPLLWTRWCLLHAGCSQAVLRVPPVVLITVHDEGMQQSGMGEESRGDPRCSARGKGRDGGRNCTLTWTDHEQWTLLCPYLSQHPPPPLIVSRAAHLTPRFVKKAEIYTLHTLPAHDSSCHVFQSTPWCLFFSVSPSPVTNHLHSKHTPIYSPQSVFSSHRCIICAYHYCFSTWFSSSSARMNSYQIKLTPTSLPPSACTTPHRDPKGPPPTSLSLSLSFSLYEHLSFYPSFDISGSFCHLRGPAERWGALVARGGEP